MEQKGKKHAIKIPSSLGLFSVDSSCFFVSGPKGEEGTQKTFKKTLHLYQSKRKVANVVCLCSQGQKCCTRTEQITLNSSVFTAQDPVSDCLVNDPRGHFSSTLLPISPDTLLLCKEKINELNQAITLFGARESKGMPRRFAILLQLRTALPF